VDKPLKQRPPALRAARRGGKLEAQVTLQARARPAVGIDVAAPQIGEAPLEALYQSPEFLIRRAHQVAAATFAQACADLEITPSQYAVLFALRQHADIGQNAIGRLVSLDRSTTSLVVKSLKDRRLVSVVPDPSDRRKTFLKLTDEGRLMLADAESRSATSNKALLSVFDRQQADEFLDMLQRFSQTRA
jgi:DNA-binding MarR family transcriptional regulator